MVFDRNVGYQLGDRWRIKAYPVHQIVEVSRLGTFAERLRATKENLIRAGVNRVRNLNELSISASPSPASASYDGSIPPISSMNMRSN